MIRDLRLTDVPLQLLPGRLAGEDLAVTHDEIARARHRLSPLEIARWSVAPAKHERHLAATRHGRLEALAVLRPRRGPRAWEVAHLFAAHDGEQAVVDLLERSVGYVASQRGERLFVRVLEQSPMQRNAENAGFRAAYVEEVYSLPHPMVGDLHNVGMNIRPPLPVDGYGIFRLYNAALPATARAAIGLTLDQWQDAAEGRGGSAREYVWEHEGGVRGWVRLDQRGRSVTVDALLHPDDATTAPAFVSYVAQLAWGHRNPTWVVPAPQTALAQALVSRGWQRTRSYVVLARTVARLVGEIAQSAVRA
jgi:hypothetical protein